MISVFGAAVFAVMLGSTPIRSAPMQAVAKSGTGQVSFRLTFGELQLKPNDYSGAIVQLPVNFFGSRTRVEYSIDL